MAAFSQSSSQNERGMGALCRLGMPSRRLQWLNLLRVIPSHPTKSTIERPVRLAHRRMNWTTASRMAWETHSPFRVPQALFLA